MVSVLSPIAHFLYVHLLTEVPPMTDILQLRNYFRVIPGDVHGFLRRLQVRAREVGEMKSLKAKQIFLPIFHIHVLTLFYRNLYLQILEEIYHIQNPRKFLLNIFGDRKVMQRPSKNKNINYSNLFLFEFPAKISRLLNCPLMQPFVTKQIQQT